MPDSAGVSEFDLDPWLVAKLGVCKFVGDVDSFGALTGSGVSLLWQLCDEDVRKH